MLTIHDGARTPHDDTCSRRRLLTVGSLGLGLGAGLPEWLAARSAEAASLPVLRDKSVVLLFLQGGPSHIEFFDPKMSAPSEFRSITGEVSTVHPGVTFGGTFPQLARLADRFSVVRSYGSQNSGHTYETVASGNNPLKATLGAIYARVAGNNNPSTGTPSNIVVLPEGVSPGLKLGSNFETGALPTLTQPGSLGANYAAFNPSGGSELKQNMELRLSADRFDDRRQLLGLLDRVRRTAESQGLLEGVDRYQQQAFEVILRGVAEAFDLSREDRATVARYDTAHLFRNDEVQKWGDMRRSTNLLGRQMLLARRLCEAGCGFVTVSDCGWDMHSNGNSPKNLGGMNWLGPQTDHAVAAFIQDVEDRGLSDRILLIVTGEMGRTPRINRDGGRDHYGELTPLLLSGGGLKRGQVIGESDRTASRPAAERYTPANLASTVLHTLFDVAQLRLDQTVPRELLQFLNASPPIGPLMPLG
jgi:uncharacterized protein (DUF1501 family)